MTEADEMQDAALVIGASGGIGNAVLQHYLAGESFHRVIGVSRGQCPTHLGRHRPTLRWLRCDYSEEQIANTVQLLAQEPARLRRIVICNGILHDGKLAPEKSLHQVTGPAMAQVFNVNVVIPALWLGALPAVLRDSPGCAIATLSARVGSISENRLGGWYSYRSSKAALNMVLKSAAVEYARRLPRVKLVAFHPGTTDTPLSRPFQRRLPEGQLLTPGFVARRLEEILAAASPDGELSFVAWDGSTVAW